MPFTADQIEEMNVLLLFNLDTTQEGIKVHASADPERIAATQRLYAKNLLTQEDGGYLTDLGHQTAEHIQATLGLLKEPE